MGWEREAHPCCAKQAARDILTAALWHRSVITNIRADQSKNTFPAGSVLAEHTCDQPGMWEAWAHP